jgi:hypothetical protein
MTVEAVLSSAKRVLKEVLVTWKRATMSSYCVPVILLSDVLRPAKSPPV